DKTGTLTTGQLRVTEIETTHGVSENELLQIAAGIAQSSTHPLSRAVVEENDRRGLSKLPAGQITNVPGFGMRAILDGAEVLVGSRRFVAPDEALENSDHEGVEAEVWVGRGQPLGVIRLRDELRAATKDVIAELKAAGETVVLISGDRARTAEAI